MVKKQKMRTLWGNPYKDGHPVEWQNTMDKKLLEEELDMGWSVVKMCPFALPMFAPSKEQEKQSIWGVLVIIEKEERK